MNINKTAKKYLLTTFKALKTIGEINYLFFKIIKGTFEGPFYFKKMLEQIVSIGLGSSSIAIVVGLVMGLVMTLNFGYGLMKFGAVFYVPSMVSLSLIREMSPIFTSLLVAGRVASGMAAELGAMNVTQQIDALRALGTSPVKILVIPRFWASVISLPLLNTISSAFGLLGGLIISNLEFGMAAGFYLDKVRFGVRLHDYIGGCAKSLIFGAIIATVGCYRGLKTKEGTRGVGEATTWAVVTSSIAILVCNFFLTKIFLVIIAK
jgi:phospholipid/cholesterol/gamma-HCH transport system permease protein